jgi:hypothetical protein
MIYHVIRQPRHATLLCAALFILASSPTAAGEDVTLALREKKGQRVQYQVVRTKALALAGKPEQKTVARSVVTIEVLERTGDTYVIAWTLSNIQFDDAKQADLLTQKLFSLDKGFRIVMELKEGGDITGLRNWQDLQEHCKKVLDLMVDELKQAKADENIAPQLKMQVQSRYSTKERLEGFGTRDARVLFFPLGLKFKGSRPIEYDQTIPNPYIGEDFPAKAKIALKSMDKKRNVAEISWSVATEPEATRRIWLDTLSRLAKKTGQPPPKPDSAKSFHVEDKVEYEVDITSGWPLKMNHKRTTHLDGGVQEDSLIFVKK